VLAPPTPPLSTRHTHLETRLSSESIKQTPSNQSTPQLPTTTRTRIASIPHPEIRPLSRTVPTFHTSGRKKSKSTGSQTTQKYSIAIFRKKFTFLVSCPREPLENYAISKTIVGDSSNETLI